REPNDYLVFEPSVPDAPLRATDARGVRITGGGAQTYRWYADSGNLYWIAASAEGTLLRVTQDGEHWQSVEFPPDVGAPTDVVRFRDTLVVLTERALIRIDGSKSVVIARVRDKRTPFELTDFFCAAPLAVLNGELYAGGQRDGSLYKLVND